MSNNEKSFIVGTVKNYREKKQRTPTGIYYTLKFDLDVSSPNDLVGEVSVLMKGCKKNEILENGNIIQFDKSKASANGRNYIVSEVQNTDTLKWVKLDSECPPPVFPWNLVIIGIAAAIIIIGAMFVFSDPFGSTECAGKPNLVIEDLEHSPARIFNNDQVHFSLIVKNFGDCDSPQSVLVIHTPQDNVGQVSYTIPPLAPGQDHPFDRYVNVSGIGVYDVLFEVDPGNFVDESGESDNREIYPIRISP